MSSTVTITKYSKVTTTTRTTKLYGKDLSAYDDVDIDELLLQLTPAQIEQLSKEVDPDDNLLPAHERCRDQTDKADTGPVDRTRLLGYLDTSAREDPDWPELKPFEYGKVRGKKWTPKVVPRLIEERISYDIGDDYERALNEATESELVDLAAILGLHSMMNQDQFYSAVTNKKNMFGKFESVVKASQPKFLPLLPDNDTDVDKTIQQVGADDPSLTSLNWNNIKNVSVEKFLKLFDGLKNNTKLQQLSLSNTRMGDTAARGLCGALEENKAIKVVNVESNYISPPVVSSLVRSLLATQTVNEFRASNQRPSVLGVKTEMDIARMVEENENLRRLGLHFNVQDAQVRVHRRLQRNSDSLRLKRMRGGIS